MVHQNVARLQVSVNNPSVVQRLKAQNNLSCVELYELLTEADVVLEMESQVTAIEEIQNKVEALGRLEGVVKLHDKRTVKFFEILSFDLSVHDLLLFEHIFLVKCLHSKKLSRLFFFDKVYLAYDARANHFLDFKIVNFDV